MRHAGPERRAWRGGFVSGLLIGALGAFLVAYAWWPG